MAIRNALGIDFGTDTIKICDKKKNIILCEKNMIAIRDNSHVIAIGDGAYEMFEKTPVSVKAGCPMRKGVIAEAKNSEIVLSYLLKKHKRILSGRPAIFIAVPRDISPVQKRAYYNVLSGIIQPNRIYLVDKGIADNLGVGVSLDSQRASMLVNIGAGTTEISIVADGKILLSKTLQLGGDCFDEDIIKMCRRVYNVHVGKKTAKLLKHKLAFAEEGPAEEMSVCGISTITGLPVVEQIPSSQVSNCILYTINMIISEIGGIINRLPPQFHQDILQAGLCLAGGSSMIMNMSSYFRKRLNISIHVVREPGLTTMRGIQTIMENPEMIKKYTYSVHALTGSMI